MKKFNIKVSLFLVLPLFVLSLTIILLPPSEFFKKSLFFSLIDKNKLLEETNKPRLIFIGGSNLSFGLDSKRIKDSLKFNPINTGIHTSLGLKFMLANAEKFILQNLYPLWKQAQYF